MLLIIIPRFFDLSVKELDSGIADYINLISSEAQMRIESQ